MINNNILRQLVSLFEWLFVDDSDEDEDDKGTSSNEGASLVLEDTCAPPRRFRSVSRLVAKAGCNSLSANRHVSFFVNSDNTEAQNSSGLTSFLPQQLHFVKHGFGLFKIKHFVTWVLQINKR